VFLVAAQAQTTTTPKKNTSAPLAKQPNAGGASCNQSPWQNGRDSLLMTGPPRFGGPPSFQWVFAIRIELANVLVVQHKQKDRPKAVSLWR
jgi:hypothetical protein